MPSLASLHHCVRAVRRSVRAGSSYPAALARFVKLYRRDFSPREIECYELLDPAVPDASLDFLLSREAVIQLDRTHVVPTYLCLTSDKAVFYAICRAARLPTPELYAVFDVPEGWTCDGRGLSSRDAWLAYFAGLPERFVIKPALGLLGAGFAAYRRDGDAFVDHEDRRCSAAELYDDLLARGSGNLFTGSYSHHSLRLPRGSHKSIVQEHLRTHPAIAELTGSSAVSTIRVVTHVDVQGRPAILATPGRLIGGSAPVDNFQKGRSGNLWMTVDPASGRIVQAYALSADGLRLERTDRHPVTKRALRGFEVPCWDDVLRLGLRLAAVFRPQSLVHWDIACTERGVVAIEGNVGGEVSPTPLTRPVASLFGSA